MQKKLEAKEIERLENTSFASAFANTAELAAPADATGAVCQQVTDLFTHVTGIDCVVETVADLTTAVGTIDTTGTLLTGNYTTILTPVTGALDLGTDAGLLQAVREGA